MPIGHAAYAFQLRAVASVRSGEEPTMLIYYESKTLTRPDCRRAALSPNDKGCHFSVQFGADDGSDGADTITLERPMGGGRTQERLPKRRAIKVSWELRTKSGAKGVYDDEALGTVKRVLSIEGTLREIDKDPCGKVMLMADSGETVHFDNPLISGVPVARTGGGYTFLTNLLSASKDELDPGETARLSESFKAGPATVQRWRVKGSKKGR